MYLHNDKMAVIWPLYISTVDFIWNNQKVVSIDFNSRFLPGQLQQLLYTQSLIFRGSKVMMEQDWPGHETWSRKSFLGPQKPVHNI